MAAIDFTEIHESHIATGQQDRFELFARDFFAELYGFRVVSEPNRGADGGKDILFEEKQKGNLSENVIRWLVSCKHKAHTGTSVNPSDEENISDRLQQHNAKGFIGFYSTLPSSGLNTRLDAFRNQYYIEVFNHERIEQELIKGNQYDLFKRYFPESFRKWIEKDNRPSKILSEFETLKCAVCGKGLLPDNGEYESIIVMYENVANDYRVEDVCCVCKGDCDDAISEDAKRKGCITGWFDITDFLIPTIFIRKIMATMNNLFYDGHNGQKKFTEEAFIELKTIIITISQYVLRFQSGEDFERAIESSMAEGF